MTDTIATQKREERRAEYSRLLLTDSWRERRAKILDRDLNRCRNCGSKAGLEVHHRQYHKQRLTGAFRRPWEYEDKYLVTLCSRCHKAGHEQYKVPVFNV